MHSEYCSKPNYSPQKNFILVQLTTNRDYEVASTVQLPYFFPGWNLPLALKCWLVNVPTGLVDIFSHPIFKSCLLKGKICRGGGTGGGRVEKVTAGKISPYFAHSLWTLYARAPVMDLIP